MAEKLTKTTLKNELTRRINWFEESFGFSDDTSFADVEQNNIGVMYGRYLTLVEIRYQIENNLFIGGFAC